MEREEEAEEGREEETEEDEDVFLSFSCTEVRKSAICSLRF